MIIIWDNEQLSERQCIFFINTSSSFRCGSASFKIKNCYKNRLLALLFIRQCKIVVIHLLSEFFLYNFLKYDKILKQ